MQNVFNPWLLRISWAEIKQQNRKHNKNKNFEFCILINKSLFIYVISFLQTLIYHSNCTCWYNESLECNYLMPPDLLNSVRRLLQRCRILQQTLLSFPKNTKQMMRLLTFCELVNSERLLFRKFNFEFKLLLQEIFPLQILNKIALNKT